MQATAPTWVSWYRRERARDAPRGKTRARARNALAVYTFGRDPQTYTELIRRVFRVRLVNGTRTATAVEPGPVLYRLSSMLGPKRGLPPAERWLPAAPQPVTQWRVPSALYGDVTQRHEYESISLAVPAGATGAEPAGGPLRGWGAAARGWAAGALLLALLVLLVRTAERCMDRRLLHRASARDAERPPSGAHAPGPGPDECPADLPPPYSECAAHGAGAVAGPVVVDASKLEAVEEPPPPYSACFVAFSNPKDGVPSVHIRNRRQREEAGSSRKIPDDEEGTEMIVENGGVVVRPELGVEDVSRGATMTSSHRTTCDDYLPTGDSPSGGTRERVFRV